MRLPRESPHILVRTLPDCFECLHTLRDWNRTGAEAGEVFFDKLDVASVLDECLQTCREAKAGILEIPKN
jgi:hypothetical protein